jgi:predicted dehydrogenase
MPQSTLSRRTFTRSAVGGAVLTAASYRRVWGANERIGVGFIGYGLIGKRHVLDFQAEPDVACVAVSDVHSGRQDEARRQIGQGCRGYSDFRKLLDDKDVEAVVVSTPDHWHALTTMLACAAGKDVYVEKPLTLFPREGRWMIDVAAKSRSVVQVGTQQRSGPHYQRARELIRGGRIGRVVSVRAQAHRNIFPGYGAPPDGSPPPELDYNLWLGPAPLRPYNPNRAIYHFRWFWDYSGGQMTNLGQHQFDIADWILGGDALKSVASTGGRYALQDNGETPDVQDALFDFDGWTAAWSHRECAAGEKSTFGLTFHGTKGTLGISRNGFTVVADENIPPQNTVPQFTDAHPIGGPQPAKTLPKQKVRTEPLADKSGDARQQFKLHARNFLDCIKSRQQPISELESGHRVATLCHLANLSLRLGRKLRWDPAKEDILDDPEASAMLARPYRAPWEQELRSLGVGGA